MKKKVLRYIELSKKFNKSDRELFGDETVNKTLKTNDYIITTSNINDYTAIGSISSINNSSKTIIDVLRGEMEWDTKKKELEIIKAEEYAEYLTLQKNLETYYRSLIKLSK